MRRSAGFTLIELMIVLVIIAIIATIALPLLVSSKISANEKAALATLRLIGQAQIQFQTSGVADQNDNGGGEYGTFGELSGAGGTGLLDLPGGGADAAVDANLAESVWCCCGWPSRVDGTGRRAFFTNQTGAFYYTEHHLYSGPGAPLAPGAALTVGGAINNILGEPAHNAPGRDGNDRRSMGK